MVDEKDFFREVTLQICSSLEIEKALWDCLMYIRNQMIMPPTCNQQIYLQPE